MNANKPNAFLPCYIIAAIFGLALLQQYLLQFNCDVSFAIATLTNFLHGKHYFTDIINTNPPLGFYIYLPAYLLMHVVGLSMRTSLWIYLFSLAAFSLWLCNRLLPQKLTHQHRHWLLIAIAFSFTLLQSYQFGQRSHIAITLLLPYLFLISNQLDSIHLSKKIRIFVAILAGIGFALNAFYLILLLAIEALRINQKKWRALETFIILLIQLVYYVAILWLFPNYFTKILPIALHLYLPGYALHWYQLLLQPTILYVVAILLISLYVYAHQKQRHHRFLILIAATLAFLLTYLLQKKIFYYHRLPAIAMATLLATELYITYRESLSDKKERTLVFLVDINLFVPLLLFFIPIYQTFFLSFESIAYRHTFYQPILKLVEQKTKPTDSILFLTYHTSMSYPLLADTNRQSASRFDNFWALPALVKFPHNKAIQAYKKLILDIIWQDLQKNQPALIIIDTAPKEFYFGPKHFDYLAFLKQDARLHSFLNKYHLIAKYEHYQVYGKH